MQKNDKIGQLEKKYFKLTTFSRFEILVDAIAMKTEEVQDDDDCGLKITHLRICLRPKYCCYVKMHFKNLYMQ